MLYANITDHHYVRFIFDNDWLKTFDITIDDILSNKTLPATFTDEMFSNARKTLHVTIDNHLFSCRRAEKISDSTMLMEIKYKQTLLQKLKLFKK